MMSYIPECAIYSTKTLVEIIGLLLLAFCQLTPSLSVQRQVHGISAAAVPCMIVVLSVLRNVLGAYQKIAILRWVLVYMVHVLAFTNMKIKKNREIELCIGSRFVREALAAALLPATLRLRDLLLRDSIRHFLGGLASSSPRLPSPAAAPSTGVRPGR